MQHLSSLSTRAPDKYHKEKIKEKTQTLAEKISNSQKVLYAQKKFSLLIILQGLDASGKDGLIAAVFKGLNQLGVNVRSFKKPTAEEASHDFLWRIHPHVPAAGMITVFNRSYYEDLLFPCINNKMNSRALKERMDDINNFEKLLRNNNTAVLKFYLHISHKEQLERLHERKTNPEKFWKHNDEDWIERRKWDRYMDAYEMLFKHCNRPAWKIIPSDQNWYKEYLATKYILEMLDELPLKYPKLT